MLKMFKRLVGIEPESVRPAKRPVGPKRRTRDPTGPLPLPEVIEGNEHTDWDLWQDSVDSQMQSLKASPNTYVDTIPSELDGLDPFARVSKNSDL
jgi:hypothetical protein